MSHATGTLTMTVPSAQAERKVGLGQRAIVPILLAVVIIVDQTVKWWAWRHVPGADINVGGDILVGATIGRWYADPTAGALLDLLDFGLVSVAVVVLMRRRLPARVRIPGALMIAGWSSNLLDRLGMHYWTAPGSARGAVDFIHIGGTYYNIADFFIIGATPVFLLATGSLAMRARTGSVSIGALAPTTPHRPRPLPRARLRTSALAGAAGVVLGVIVVVGIGAANYGGLTAPLASADASTQQ